MGSRDGETKFKVQSQLPSLTQNSIQSQAKENSTDMNMAMRHSYEFVKLLPQKHHF